MGPELVNLVGDPAPCKVPYHQMLGGAILLKSTESQGRFISMRLPLIIYRITCSAKGFSL